MAGVWAPWAGHWVASPGTTTINGAVPLRTDMRFRIGTNTTAMTCTVLLRLVDEGRVALSDPVSTYLNHVVGVGDITLGQLCQNTSGLPDTSAALTAQFVSNPTRQWPPMELVSNSLAGARLTAPGGAWAHSDTGIVLLGMALQAATNQDWASLYRQYLFDPLDLNDTSFPAATELEIPGPHPHGYATALTATGQMVCESLYDDTTLSTSLSGVAGGIISTLDDMKIWTQALADGRLLSSTSTKAQWAAGPRGTDLPSWQNHGLGTEQFGPLRGHGGTIPGFISATLSDPTSGLTVVIMLNNSSAGGAFAQTLARRLATIASTAPAAPTATVPPSTLPWSEEQTVTTLQATAVCQLPAAPVR
ncbi:serine hydrolase [Cryobacterium sp. HLT2-28]|uniref:serine hydrolase domain-containing protein n=1 Tax=Cryobacterium sp. HLT2-28 TaxID=1259146 RepID=UPI00141B372A|nr:serine hydrolase domain-containing protein [Cryobacterium sp. HLT2-28]